MLYKFIFFISRLVREFKMFVNFDKNFFYWNGHTWEFIPRMTNKRLNEITTELKNVGLKCNKILTEQKVRNRNVRTDKTTINKINKCSNLSVRVLPAITEDKVLKVTLQGDLYNSNSTIDDLYDAFGINNSTQIEQTLPPPEDVVDFNPDNLEQDDRFKFTKR